MLHRSNPAFVPPFPGSVRKFLEPGSPFQRQHGEIAGFLARRDGRVVGRIAAILNRSHNQYHGDRTGFFGFFNCENDSGLAAALFDTARTWLREQGCDRIRGPYNPSINDDCGLMTEGFSSPPSVSMPWNPEYYENLVLAEGFTVVCEMAGFDLPLASANLKLTERIARRAAEQSSLTLRPLRMDRLESELAIFEDLYNRTLERNWGFVPITNEDFMSAAEDLKALVDPNVVLIAEDNGKPAGLGVNLPDFNEILIRLKHTPHFLRVLHTGILMKTHRYRNCRFVILGILPEYRKGPLLGWLFHDLIIRTRSSFRGAELSWIDTTNTEVLRFAERMGAHRFRTYRIYEAPLE